MKKFKAKKSEVKTMVKKILFEAPPPKGNDDELIRRLVQLRSELGKTSVPKPDNKELANLLRLKLSKVGSKPNIKKAIPASSAPKPNNPEDRFITKTFQTELGPQKIKFPAMPDYDAKPRNRPVSPKAPRIDVKAFKLPDVYASFDSMNYKDIADIQKDPDQFLNEPGDMPYDLRSTSAGGVVQDFKKAWDTLSLSYDQYTGDGKKKHGDEKSGEINVVTAEYFKLAVRQAVGDYIEQILKPAADILRWYVQDYRDELIADGELELNDPRAKSTPEGDALLLLTLTDDNVDRTADFSSSGSTNVGTWIRDKVFSPRTVPKGKSFGEEPKGRKAFLDLKIKRIEFMSILNVAEQAKTLDMESEEPAHDPYWRGMTRVEEVLVGPAPSENDFLKFSSREKAKYINLRRKGLTYNPKLYGENPIPTSWLYPDPGFRYFFRGFGSKKAYYMDWIRNTLEKSGRYKGEY